MTLNRLAWMCDDITEDTFVRVVTTLDIYAGKFGDCPVVLRQSDVQHFSVKGNEFWFYMKEAKTR